MILLIPSSRAIRGSATEIFAKKAVTNETTAASNITDFSKPNLLTIPTLTPYLLILLIII